MASNYYVYQHIDPETDEVIYIGRGSGSRAWMYVHPFRSEEHSEYLEDLVDRGYLPSDWVRIESRRLTKDESVLMEKKFLAEFRPRFNKIPGLKLLKITEEILKTAFELREKGWSYDKIAKEVGLNTMTLHRGMNQKIPALEALRAAE